MTEGLVVLTNRQKNKMKITNVYSLPITKRKGIDERVLELFTRWLNGSEDHIIAEDFNLHYERWSKIPKKEQANNLIEWCNNNDFKILNDENSTYR